MTFALTVKRINEALTNGATAEELFEDYITLAKVADKENFVMAVLAELAVAQRRLDQSQ